MVRLMPIYRLGGKEPKIHKSVFVAPTASIIGDVVICEGSSVWPGAVVRGDVNNIKIGKYSNIQDNAVIHVTISNSTEIGDHVTIGHGAVIHASTIMSNVLIGMKAVILDGARVNKNCIIGAGAVVLENEIIPENSLAVGIPANVVKTLDLNEQEKRAKISTSRYYQLAQRYKEQF